MTWKLIKGIYKRATHIHKEKTITIAKTEFHRIDCPEYYQIYGGQTKRLVTTAVPQFNLYVFLLWTNVSQDMTRSMFCD